MNNSDIVRIRDVTIVDYLVRILHIDHCLAKVRVELYGTIMLSIANVRGCYTLISLYSTILGLFDNSDMGVEYSN